MSNQLIPFDFENHSVRLVVDDNGDVWFVGKDVCEVLGYADPTNAMKQHCKGVVKRHPLLTAGGIQELRIISRPDFLRLVTNSRLESAVKFEKKVFEEILPAIWDTGHYGKSPTTPVQSATDIANFYVVLGEAMTRITGVNPGIAMAAALEGAGTATGLPIEPLRKSLSPAQLPLASLNATQLGQYLSLSAKAMNKKLEEMGSQTRNARNEWELTKMGMKWGEMVPYATRNGHSGYQILWKKELADSLFLE